MSGPSREIRAQIRRPWASVPFDVMEDRRLGLSARLVCSYLLGLANRPNWTIRVRHVCTALGMSQSTWQRLRRELEAVGYFMARRERDARGRIRWVLIVTDEPGTIGRKSTDGIFTDAVTSGGDAADLRNSTSRTPRSSSPPRVDGDDLPNLIERVAVLVANGRGPAAGKEPQYLARPLGRHVTQDEADRIMSAVRERAADITAAKHAQRDEVQRRMEIAERRSVERALRELGLT